METAKTPDYPRGVTFEQVWTALMENREQMKETDLQMKETDRRMQETERLMKETFQKMGELGNRFGELAEHLVAPGIKDKFKELNFNFEQISQDHTITDSSGRCIAEVDIMLENGETVMVVEVKAKPLQKDVDEHLSRIEILRCRADARLDKRKFQGALAGAIMKEGVRDYAHKAGLYTIEPTGETIKISIPEGFKAREW